MIPPGNDIDVPIVNPLTEIAVMPIVATVLFEEITHFGCLTIVPENNKAHELTIPVPIVICPPKSAESALIEGVDPQLPKVGVPADPDKP